MKKYLLKMLAGVALTGAALAAEPMRIAVMDFDDQREAALKALQGWVASGKIKVQEDIIDGLENTPAALIGLLNGENRGKRMIRV